MPTFEDIWIAEESAPFVKFTNQFSAVILKCLTALPCCDVGDMNGRPERIKDHYEGKWQRLSSSPRRDRARWDPPNCAQIHATRLKAGRVSFHEHFAVIQPKMPEKKYAIPRLENAKSNSRSDIKNRSANRSLASRIKIDLHTDIPNLKTTSSSRS